MGEARRDAVFGTGQAGSALVEQLAVSRNRPLAGGIDWRAADATDPEVAADAAKGASVVYQPVYAPYTQWPKRSRCCSGACWLLPSAPVRCWWCWRTYRATARPRAKPTRPGRRRKGHESH